MAWVTIIWRDEIALTLRLSPINVPWNDWQWNNLRRSLWGYFKRKNTWEGKENHIKYEWSLVARYWDATLTSTFHCQINGI